MEIRYKSQFFKLWKEGVLGNRTLLSDDIEEALSWKTEKIGFREVGKTGGGAWELADRADASEVYVRWKSLGRVFLMDGSVPNNKTTIQGEVIRTVKGLESFLCVRRQVIEDFYIIFHNLAIRGEEIPTWVLDLLNSGGLPPMRQTMARGLHRHRGYLETRLLLREFMDPSSRDDLDTLLEMYPDAAIEFSCFDINTGVLPRRNTIFWEVRNY
jgi:hypothetical protein